MDENNENEQGKMTEEEYLKGEPGYQEPSDDLPSEFLEEENQADEINIIMLPKYKPNISLILDNYIEEIVGLKKKSELKQKLFDLFEMASAHGALSERMDKLQKEIEDVQASYDAMTKDYSDVIVTYYVIEDEEDVSGEDEI